MGPQRSAVVVGAIWLTIGAVALTGVTAVFTVVFKDELVNAWAAGRADVGGSVTPPAFVPVAVTMFFVYALLSGVLIALFSQGHNWARVMLSALMVLIAATTVAILRIDPPALFVVLALVSLLVDLAAAVALWMKDTRAYCRAVGQLTG